MASSGIVANIEPAAEAGAAAVAAVAMLLTSLQKVTTCAAWLDGCATITEHFLRRVACWSGGSACTNFVRSLAAGPALLISMPRSCKPEGSAGAGFDGPSTANIE